MKCPPHDGRSPLGAHPRWQSQPRSGHTPSRSVVSVTLWYFSGGLMATSWRAHRADSPVGDLGTRENSFAGVSQVPCPLLPTLQGVASPGTHGQKKKRHTKGKKAVREKSLRRRTWGCRVAQARRFVSIEFVEPRGLHRDHCPSFLVRSGSLGPGGIRRIGAQNCLRGLTCCAEVLRIA